MARILLGVTGSVAAIKTPELVTLLESGGHHVEVVATKASLYFFDTKCIPRERLHLDEDEWPGLDSGRRWRTGEEVLHIELRRRSDLLLIAPLDANTLAKLAGGLADNCLTCVYRAWEPSRPIVLAPAMNTKMWEHPLTARHLRQLAEDFGSATMSKENQELISHINRSCPRLRIAAPQCKTLACGDVGIGAMAAVESIGMMVNELLEYCKDVA
jgi:phosphopantothenoylcysteine decarboxylase